MTGEELLKALGAVDSGLVEDAAEMPRRQPGRRLLLAACLAGLLGVSALAGELLTSVRVAEVSSGLEESGYRIQAELAPFPADGFSREAREALVENWQTWEEQDELSRMASSASPGSCVRNFDTWAESVRFLGAELENPLEDCPWLTWASQSAIPLDAESLRGQGHHSRVSWYGDREGTVAQAAVCVGYLDGENRVALQAELYTELTERSTGAAWAEYVAFETETWPIRGREPAVVVIPKGTEHYSSMDAWFGLDGALYAIHVVGPAGEEQSVRETLERVLDCFGT